MTATTEHDTPPPRITPPGWTDTYGPDYLTEAQVSKLLEGIHPGRVAVLEGLSHLEAYDVRAHLTRVFGFGRWGEQILDLTELYALPTTTKNGKEAVKVAYRATVRLTVCTPKGTPLQPFDGAAVGESIMPEFKRGDAFDMAIKTSLSQALKRAAIDLGDQFGLSLYRQGSKDPLIVRLFAGMPGSAPVVSAPEPSVVPEERPVDAIDPAELDVDTATGEVRSATAQRAQAPAVQSDSRRVVPAQQAPSASQGGSGTASPAAAGGPSDPHAAPDLGELRVKIGAATELHRLDQMQAWLDEHGLAERVPPGQDGEEYTLGQLIEGRRDALRDAQRAGKAATPAPPVQPAQGAHSPAQGVPHAEGHTPSATPDPQDKCRPGAPRKGVVQSLHGMGVTDEQIVAYFGRPVEQVATPKLTGLVRHVIAVRNGAPA